MEIQRGTETDRQRVKETQKAKARDNASSSTPSSDAPMVQIAGLAIQDWNQQTKDASTVEQKATSQMNVPGQEGGQKKVQKTKMVK